MKNERGIRMHNGIPDIFKPHKSETPFEKCSICEKEIFHTGEQYMIEKAIKRYKNQQTNDLIFEYAMCMDCSQELASRISQESMQMINMYFNQNKKIQNRMKYLALEDPNDLDPWLSTCLIKGTPVEELEEYQIAGMFQGENMIVSDFPYLISGKVGEEINELLSKQTKEEFDNFKRKILAPPPEFEELFKRKLIFI